MKRAEKERVVAEVLAEVERARGLFFTDFAGLTVAQATELRREFRKAGVGYRVVKNTLIRKALERATGYEEVYDRLTGPTGIALAYDEAVAPAKIIQRFAEKHKKLSLKVCVVERRVYDGSKLDQFAKLPTRPEVMAQTLGIIQAPIAGVPGVLQAVVRDLVSVVAEIEKKKAA
ncbi:MAG: 50S ribosomal protein L10 [Bacteroidota bacterium]